MPDEPVKEEAEDCFRPARDRSKWPVLRRIDPEGARRDEGSDASVRGYMYSGLLAASPPILRGTAEEESILVAVCSGAFEVSCIGICRSSTLLRPVEQAP
jgi:hypothetical protein